MCDAGSSKVMSDAVRIISVKNESNDTKTFTFDWDAVCKAGQFIMVWIPGTDEIPMSLSSVRWEKSITVKAIGEATRKLHELKKGDVLHIRGPYGNGFSVEPRKKILAVAGGVGMAALMPVVRETKADVVLGARTSGELIFEEEASRYSDVRVSTDDGSKGFRGNAVQLMRQRLSEKKYDLVMGCGPEIMLYYLHKACAEEKVQCQLSLERYMKCGAGVCGSCMIDSQRVCADGPVFTGEEIASMKEFGQRRRDPSGVLIKL